jgi:hypothetical protein
MGLAGQVTAVRNRRNQCTKTACAVLLLHDEATKVAFELLQGWL